MWGFSRCWSVRVGLIERLSLAAAPTYRHLGLLSLIGEDGMSQNALLRSVKGLGVPSTARKEDRKTRLKVAASPAAESFPCKDHFAVRNGIRCAGVHLIVDLHGAKRLNDIDHIEATLRRCIEAARATLLHIHLHHFQPSGVSGVAVLAESHISIHTWPEAGYAALDIFMCGSAEPDNCIPVLREAFAAQRVDVNEILRGQAP
jgi:S-adenosylmethionine decarboxylase